MSQLVSPLYFCSLFFISGCKTSKLNVFVNTFSSRFQDGHVLSRHSIDMNANMIQFASSSSLSHDVIVVLYFPRPSPFFSTLSLILSHRVYVKCDDTFCNQEMVRTIEGTHIEALQRDAL